LHAAQAVELMNRITSKITAAVLRLKKRWRTEATRLVVDDIDRPLSIRRGFNSFEHATFQPDFSPATIEASSQSLIPSLVAWDEFWKTFCP
jgi:hypothetical protein